jgi:hypothetical protein
VGEEVGAEVGRPPTCGVHRLACSSTERYIKFPCRVAWWLLDPSGDPSGVGVSKRIHSNKSSDRGGC